MNLVLKVAILQKFGSQSDFAREARLNETILSRIVNGRRIATDEQRKTISQILGVPANEIFPS